MAVIVSGIYPKSERRFKYYQIDGTDTEAGFSRYILNVKSLSLYEFSNESQPRYFTNLALLPALMNLRRLIPAKDVEMRSSVSNSVAQFL